MKRVVATNAHTIPDRPPLRIHPGDSITVGQRDTEWPAFAFVTTAAGSGWVPARYLSVAEGPGIALEPYDTTELSTEAGDVLEVVAEDTESGWLWCRNQAGHKGWVPMSSLRPARDETSR